MRRGRRSRSPMRVVHLSHDMEAIGRLFSPDHAIEAARDRRDRTYDPALADLFVEHGRAWLEQLADDRPVGRRARPRARAPPRAVGRAARRRPDRRRRLHRPQVAVHGRAQPSLRGARGRRRPRARAPRGRRHLGPPRGARARLRHHRRAELDLGQARVAHAHGVRSGRAPPDADRADAAPLAGSGRAQSRRGRAPREVRRLRVPQARASPTATISERASWRRRRSTSG